MSLSTATRALSILLSLGCVCRAADAATDSDIRAAVDRMMPTLVRIHVVMEQGSEGRMRKNQGSGSGAIISPEGYVLTNHHVAGHGTRFVCTLSNREEVDATLVGTDALSDLAVIKLDLSTRRDPSQPLAVATFGDSSRLQVGDVVLAMGCPGGLSQSITRGIVANTEMIVPRHQISMTLDGEKVGELVRWIGHDAVIYPGNSGGPLVNLDGEIVGVNEVGIASLGGAIPANLAKQVAAGLIEKGRIVRSWIGLEPQTLLRSMNKAKGLLVSDVWPESPAGKAGIRAGDFVTHYNGQVLPDCHAAEDLPLFHAMVLGTAPGTKVTLKGERDGKPIEWQLVTEEREPNMARESESREWGLTLRNLTKVSALELRRKNTRGVVVDSVKTGGPSNQGKPPLRPEDVILKLGGTEIADVAAFNRFTAEFTAGLSKPKPLLVEFDRGTESLVTVIDVGPEEDPSQPQMANKPWLGATSQVLTDDLTEVLQIKGKRGVRLTSVIPASPAGRAGLQVGDLLFKLDGRVINARRPEDSGVLPELIRAYPVDAKISFEIQRGAESKTIEVQLEPSPASDQQPRDFTDDRFEFTVTEPSEHQRSLAALTGAKSGLTVAKVETAGWAALGGLVAGDVLLEVNGADITSLDALKQALEGLRTTKPRSVIFFVQRGPRSVYLEIEPRW